MLTNLQEHNYLATGYEKSYSYLGLTIWERQNLRVLAQTQTWAIIHSYVSVHNSWRAIMVQVSNCMSHTLHNSHPCISIQLHFLLFCSKQAPSLTLAKAKLFIGPKIAMTRNVDSSEGSSRRLNLCTRRNHSSWGASLWICGRLIRFLVISCTSWVT